MYYRLLSFIIVLGTMSLIVHVANITAPPPTLVLGFLLLAAYGFGFFLDKIGLPRITSYIFAGLFLGPYFFNFYSSVAELKFLNSLALAFIAFRAGTELNLQHIRLKLKTIGFMLAGITLMVFVGTIVSVVCISPLIPFLQGQPWRVVIAIAALVGVISTARSPASAIAIISETKARGPFTDIVLTITIAMDVVVIIFFAVVIAVCQVVVSPGSSVDIVFIMHLLLEIGIAFVLGYCLGKAIVFLLQNVGVELPVIIAAMGFIVIKFCHLLSEYLSDIHDITLNLEPLLICMAAGFTVHNFSKHSEHFIDSMDRISLPIYMAFFAITGASINVEVLKNSWFLGLVIVAIRMLMLFIGSYVSAKLAGEGKKIYNNAWLGFITQAGVSLGLVTEVVRRFPAIGIHIQSILIAAITVNQIIGPIAFKYVLGKVEESNVPPRKAIDRK